MLGISRYTMAAGINYTASAQNKQTAAETDGKITKNEFINSRPANVTREEAQALFTQLDTKKAGFIKRSEVLAALGRNAPSAPIAAKLSDTALTTLLLSVKTRVQTQTAGA